MSQPTEDIGVSYEWSMFDFAAQFSPPESLAQTISTAASCCSDNDNDDGISTLALSCGEFFFVGTIEIGAFFEYFEWPRNTFANHLFSFMESADEDGRVDFGDFVKVRLSSTRSELSLRVAFRATSPPSYCCFSLKQWLVSFL